MVFIPQNIEPKSLYKYRDTNKYALNSLICNQVYFSDLKKFNDPFETEKLFAETQFSQKVLLRNVLEAGVLCLCEFANNLAMWSYYGDGLKGFAIGYDLKELLETLVPVTAKETERGTRWKYVYEVKYHNYCFDPIDETNELTIRKIMSGRDIFFKKATRIKNEFRIELKDA